METTEPQENGPMTEEQVIDSLLQPIETEAEDDTDGETQEIETEDVEDDAEDDASEVEDENDDEVSDDDETDQTEDDEDSETDEDATDDETLIEVKADGETRKVTLQELKNSFAGQASLQRRHMELKTQEEQFRNFAEAMQQERQAFLQFAQQAQENGFKRPPAEPDPAMMQSDPIGYMEAEAKYRQEMKAYQQEQQQLQYERQRQEQFTKAQREQMLAQQREQLLEAIPELKDPERGKEVHAALLNTAKAYDFTDDEIGGITDARTVKLLNDARKWRELQAGKQAARKPKQEAKPVTRPKGKVRDGGKQQQAKKALERAKRTQSPDDWVNALLISET